MKEYELMIKLKILRKVCEIIKLKFLVIFSVDCLEKEFWVWERYILELLFKFVFEFEVVLYDDIYGGVFYFDGLVILVKFGFSNKGF